MPPKQFEWQQRIKSVEQEHAAARLAFERLVASAEVDPTVLRQGLPVRVVRLAADRLEGTYVIRLFAEFETGLREFWPTARGGDPPNRTRDLLDGLAATRRIPNNPLTNVHHVREYRNTLVHARIEAISSIAIAEVRKRLCTFFSFLPPDW